MSFPDRLTHAAAVDVNAGVATLLGTLGGVAGIVRNGAGDYTITLKGPGVPGFAAHSPIPLALINGNVAGSIAVMFTNATTVRVFTFDDADPAVPADFSFSFAILTSERNGAAP